MKYFNKVAIFTITLLTFSNYIFAAIDTIVYLENHYGATIKYKAGTKNSTATEVSVANQARSLIGKANTITALSIRTTGAGSTFLSPFTEITQQIEDIKKNPHDGNMNAIILIKPSKSYQNWDISINWEKAGRQTVGLTDSQLESHLELNIDKIMNGYLGNDYAEKARAINNYDYTKSSQAGFVNLRESLLKEITETNTQTYQKIGGKKGKWAAPDRATTQDLKDAIDRLYRALQKYKARDDQ
jgi:hypothetical protein